MSLNPARQRMLSSRRRKENEQAKARATHHARHPRRRADFLNAARERQATWISRGIAVAVGAACLAFYLYG
jgi:hypothetical protein